jgi:hypothetical protein
MIPCRRRFVNDRRAAGRSAAAITAIAAEKPTHCSRRGHHRPSASDQLDAARAADPALDERMYVFRREQK